MFILLVYKPLFQLRTGNTSLFLVLFALYHEKYKQRPDLNCAPRETWKTSGSTIQTPSSLN